MNHREIDPRISAQQPTESLRDLLSPVVEFLHTAPETELIAYMPEIREQLRKAFRLARDFECEVSALRWENRRLHDEQHNADRKRDEALLAALAAENCNVVLLGDGGEVPVFLDGDCQ